MKGFDIVSLGKYLKHRVECGAPQDQVLVGGGCLHVPTLVLRILAPKRKQSPVSCDKADEIAA